MNSPLWPPSNVPPFAAYWSRLKRSLPTTEHWDVWTDWYEAVSLGRTPWPEAAAVEIVRLPEEEWQKGPASVNRKIKDILERHRETPDAEVDLSQRPAPYVFDINDQKIAAEPARALAPPGSIEEQVRSVLIDKARAARDRLARTQAPQHYRTAIETLLGIIAAAVGDIPLGRLLIANRSIETAARAVDSESGQREYGDDVVAAMNDLSVSLDDFLALSPLATKILAEAQTQKLIASDAGKVNVHLEQLALVSSTVNIVDASSVVALSEGAEEIAEQTSVIETTSDDAVRAEAIETRARLVSQRLLTARNYVKVAIKGTGAVVLEGARDGLKRASTDITETAAKAGFAYLVTVIAGPVAGIASLVLTWRPFAKKLEEAKPRDKDVADI